MVTVAHAVMDVGRPPTELTVQIPEPVGHQVLVEVAAAGICHTDLTFSSTWPPDGLPVILGHEGAGVVRAVGGEVTAVRPGDRVCMTFDSCGRCEYCTRGEPAYCAESYALNFNGRPGITSDDGPVTGGFFGQSCFAGLALASDRNTVRIGDLPFALAAPLGCSVQTGVGAVTRALAVTPGQSVAVFGAGAVGLAAVMGARLAGAGDIVAVDVRADRRELALKLGATQVVEAGPDAQAAVIDATSGGAHAAVDTTARADVLTQALAALRPRGALAVTGLGSPTAELPVRTIMARGLRLVGVIEGDTDPSVHLPELVTAVTDGRIPMAELVTTFTDLGAAWRAAHEGNAVKPVWQPTTT